MKTQLKKAVLKTVAYADIFAYPLNLKQLHRFLIEQQISWDHFQKADFKNSCNSAIEIKKNPPERRVLAKKIITKAHYFSASAFSFEAVHVESLA